MKYFSRCLLCVCVVVLLGFLFPQKHRMPVQGATASDYHPKSFWYYPWGKSVVHKGVDIFGKRGTPVYSATTGIVLLTDRVSLGGKVVLVLTSQWRLHYYAHLDKITTTPFSWVTSQHQIGTLGDSGNAKGKPVHLHYAIVTLFPYLWRMDTDRQGWKKAFYLNPISYLEEEK